MRRPRHSRRGFTLFEIILASTIFVLLAGGVYFSVASCVSALDEVAREQMDARRQGAFADFLRNGFLNLPATAQVSVEADRTEGGESVRLLLNKAGDAFATGAAPHRGGGVVLATMPDGRGTSDLQIARFPDRLSESERLKNLQRSDWLPLLEGVSALRWRFFDGVSGRFLETWDNPGTQPELVELSFTTDRGEQTLLFRVPHAEKVMDPSKAGGKS